MFSQNLTGDSLVYHTRPETRKTASMRNPKYTNISLV